jgi:hypothetical protein
MEKFDSDENYQGEYYNKIYYMGLNSTILIGKMTTMVRIRKKRRMTRWHPCRIIINCLLLGIVYKWNSMHVVVHKVPTCKKPRDDWMIGSRSGQASYVFSQRLFTLDMASSQGNLALSFRKMCETEQEQQPVLQK